MVQLISMPDFSDGISVSYCQITPIDKTTPIAIQYEQNYCQDVLWRALINPRKFYEDPPAVSEGLESAQTDRQTDRQRYIQTDR